jgi:hypothetical protein
LHLFGYVGALVADCELARTQRNDVLQAIRRAVLRPEDLDWSEAPSKSSRGTYEVFRVQVLGHRPTLATFSFDIEASGLLSQP